MRLDVSTKINIEVSKTARFSGIILGLALCAPIIYGYTFTDHERRSRYEKRILNEVPSMKQLFLKPDQWFADFSSYLQDHMGFAREFHQTYRLTLHFLAGETPTEYLKFGRNGILFLTSHNQTDDLSILKGLCRKDWNEVTIQNTATAIIELSKIAKSGGNSLKVLIAPTKPVLYGHELPSSVPEEIRGNCISYRSSYTAIDKLIDSVESEGVLAHYPLDEFGKNTDDLSFYPTKSFHWSGKSSYLFARTLFRKTNINGIPQIIPIPAVGISDLSNSLGFRYSTDIYKYNYPKEFLSTNNRSEFQNELDELLKRYGEISLYKNSSSAGYKNSVIISDSFGTGFVEHIAIAYNQTRHINLNGIDTSDFSNLMEWALKMRENTDIYFLFNDYEITTGNRIVQLYSQYN